MAGGLSPIGFGAPAPVGFGSAGGAPLGGIIFAEKQPDATFALCDGSAIEIGSPAAFPFATRPVALFDPVSTLISGGTLYSMAYGNGIYLAVGTGGSAFWSTDRKTWTQSLIAGNPTSATSHIRSVAYGLGGFVVVGDNQFVGYTTDGKTITASNTQFTLNQGTPSWSDVVFDPATSSFVVVSTSNYSSGSGNADAATAYLTTLSNDWVRSGNLSYGYSFYSSNSLFVLNGSVWAAIQGWSNQNWVLCRTNNRGGSWEYKSFNDYTGSYVTVFPRVDGSVTLVGHYNFSSYFYTLPANSTSVNNISAGTGYGGGGNYFADLGAYTLYDREAGANAKLYLDTDPAMSGSAAVKQATPSGIGRGLRLNGQPLFLQSGGFRGVRAASSGFVLPTLVANTNRQGVTLYPYMKVA